MDREHDLVPSTRLLRLAARFHDKQYRDAYVAAHAREILAKQMRSFRGALSQAEYAEKIGKQKTVIGRLENPAYSGWSVRTMLEIARKENVGVLAQFVDFPTFLNFTDEMSDDTLHPQEYDETRTDDIALYLSGTKTYYDLGATAYLGDAIAMQAVAPAPYPDIFFGATQNALTLAVPGGSNFALLGTYSGTIGQSLWPSHNTVLDPLIAWESALLLPNGVARTQAAIRWLSNLAISQKNEIQALQSELASLRETLSSLSARTEQQSTNVSSLRYIHRQTFGNPLDALRLEAA